MAVRRKKKKKKKKEKKNAQKYRYMYLVLPWYGPTVVYNVAQLATMNHGDEVPTSDWLMDKQLFAVSMRVLYASFFFWRLFFLCVLTSIQT
jgi:hypothetical protein